jgi:hypothetical protein
MSDNAIENKPNRMNEFVIFDETKDCINKPTYNTLEEAREHRWDLSNRRDAYKCQFCSKFHLTLKYMTRAAYNKLYFGGNREKVIQRDGEKCVKCGMTRTQHIEKYNKDISVDHIVGFGAFDRLSPVPNNAMDNLQTLCFACHNKKDLVKRGPLPMRKLSGEQVLNIRRRLARGETAWSIAKTVGVTDPCITNIMNNRTYREFQLPDEELHRLKKEGELIKSQPVYRKCDHCSKSFINTKHNRIYCSSKCRNDVNRVLFEQRKKLREPME